MGFQVKALLMSFGLTVFLSLFIIPILRWLKVGQIERDDGPESHLKKQGTPTMGGIIMAIAITVIGAFMCYYYKGKEPEVAKGILPLVATALGFGFIGFIDDFKKLVLKNTKGLSPVAKMIGLLVVSVGFVIYMLKGANLGTETYIPFIKMYINLPVWLYVPFAVLVLLSVTNAINLTDGVDGLSTSVTTIILTGLTVIGIILGIKEVAVVGGIVIGTCLGFLLFNLNPAKVMMGDTGSLLLGGIIGAIALYLKMPLLLLLIAIIPVLETLSVAIQVTYYKKTGNRIFKMAPLHHHYELSGWNENKIVTVFSLVTVIAVAIGVLVI